MDVSSVGVANSAQFLQRASTGLQAPLTPAKQEEQAAQIIAQTAAPSAQQQPPQPPPVSPNEIGKSSVGQLLDVEA